MIIKSLTLENFKGVRDPVRIDFAPVTLLFGPNNAGKSTIVQALHFAREVLERGNTDPGRTLLGGDVMDLGGFENLVNSHDLSRSVRMALELEFSEEDSVDIFPDYLSSAFDWSVEKLWDEISSSSFTVSNIQVAFVVRWSELLNPPQPFVEQYEVSINGDVFAKISSSLDCRQIAITNLNLDHPFCQLNSDENEESTTNLRTWIEEEISQNYLGESGEATIGLIRLKSALPSWGRTLNLQDDIWVESPIHQPSETKIRFDESGNSQRIANLLSLLIISPGELVRQYLQKLRYISPFRDVPLRNHQPARSPDEFRWSNGMAAWDLLLKGENLEEKVNSWLTQEDRLNAGYSIEVKLYKELEKNGPLMLALTSDEGILDNEEWVKEEIQKLPERYELLIRDQRNNVTLFPKDVGVGISQVIPILVAALHSQSGTVAIEEPESNIHPAFQVALGDLFISQANEKQDLMFLVETHSEHLMLRFLRRIRQTNEKTLPPGAPPLTPKGVAVYFVEPDETGPRIHRIRIDKDGDFIDRWPRGFYQERVKELYE
jgi:hypothetical protein